jgi:hypothetical protein
MPPKLCNGSCIVCAVLAHFIPHWYPLGIRRIGHSLLNTGTSHHLHRRASARCCPITPGLFSWVPGSGCLLRPLVECGLSLTCFLLSDGGVGRDLQYQLCLRRRCSIITPERAQVGAPLLMSLRRCQERDALLHRSSSPVNAGQNVVSRWPRWRRWWTRRSEAARVLTIESANVVSAWFELRYSPSLEFITIAVARQPAPLNSFCQLRPRASAAAHS